MTYLTKCFVLVRSSGDLLLTLNRCSITTKNLYKILKTENKNYLSDPSAWFNEKKGAIYNGDELPDYRLAVDGGMGGLACLPVLAMYSSASASYFCTSACIRANLSF
jgi:hypothetical protein